MIDIIKKLGILLLSASPSITYSSFLSSEVDLRLLLAVQHTILFSGLDGYVLQQE